MNCECCGMGPDDRVYDEFGTPYKTGAVGMTVLCGAGDGAVKAILCDFCSYRLSSASRFERRTRCSHAYTLDTQPVKFPLVDPNLRSR